jgi:hypothetical protein
MRPVTMIRRLIESYAISSRRRSDAAGFVFGVELEVSKKIVRLVVETRKVLGGRLL